MIAQIVIFLAVLIAAGLGLWSALRRHPTSSAGRVTVPVEDSRQHLPR